jgi:uroporphyrin-III C-methyltransferase
MGLRNLDTIARGLIDGGLLPSTPVAVIASATLPEQRILISQLDRVADEALGAEFEPPAIVVIGEIVTARAGLRAVAELVAEVSL